MDREEEFKDKKKKKKYWTQGKMKKKKIELRTWVKINWLIFLFLFFSLVLLAVLGGWAAGWAKDMQWMVEVMWCHDGENEVKWNKMYIEEQKMTMKLNKKEALKEVEYF